MKSPHEPLLLVGDNPFHNISHLSQDRARTRGYTAANPEYAASLITMAVENGANGFMFSVSDTTLSILNTLKERKEADQLGLHAIVPYAYEYVKLATQLGGIPELAKKLSREIILSGRINLLVTGFKGVIKTDLVDLMKTYVMYEIYRIKSAAGKKANIQSITLHETITDIALALNLDWFFKGYIHFLSNLQITPGFNTCNFALLIEKFREWNINLDKPAIAAPFNKVGFQMNPSKSLCEKTLESVSAPILIAISILAAGYLNPIEAIDYIKALPNVSGVAVGVSKEQHATETFKLLKQSLKTSPH